MALAVPDNACGDVESEDVTASVGEPATAVGEYCSEIAGDTTVTPSSPKQKLGFQKK